MKVSIGLDIGIASVGWSVINSETGWVADLGVRLFDSQNSDNNHERREKRGSRRSNRRKRTRLRDSRVFLYNKGFHQDHNLDHVNPYELRVKGLDHELTKGEIFKVINHIIKKRGISYLEDDDDFNKEGNSDYSKELQDNAQQLKEYTPGQIQLQRLREDGRVRSGINQKGKYQLNVFTVGAYADELRRILQTQSQFHPEIDENFIDFYTHKGLGEKSGLIYRKRPYYHGPGNQANPSKYGRWANVKEDGVPKENIFDQLIGKDIAGYTRASSASKSAQIYNLLNDLNNLRIPREDPKVKLEEKEEILQRLLNEDVKSFGPKQVAKILGSDVESIKGWRLNSKNKPEIHNLNIYRKWKEIFANVGLDIQELSDQELDTLAEIITLNSDKDAVQKTMALKVRPLDEITKALILDNFTELKKAASSAKWHSFSFETLNRLIPELLHTSEEQNTILERMGLKFDLRSKYAELKHIPINDIVDEIYNPTVTKSIRQSIKILNAIVDQYGKENISHVTIEMPRDKNDDDKQKTIDNIRTYNKQRKEKGNQFFLEKSGWDQERLDFELRRKKFAQKLYYYYEQDGKCAYSGKAIQPEDLLSQKVEIDHILPLSLSLDDSINNKVLVLAHANQEKGQRTPYQAFRDGANMGQTWEDYKQWVNMNPRYKKHKKNILLFEEDIFKPQVQQRFVARNLNDTRYSSRIVLNAVMSFFYFSDTKVKVVNGAFTHTLRKKWGDALDKTRETYHHHAIDATLCAVTPFVRISPFVYKYNEEDQTKWMEYISEKTGEKIIIPYHEYKKMKTDERKSYRPQWDNFIPSIYPDKLYPRIKFSHKIDTKPNRNVSDETIYSTRVKSVTKKKKGELLRIKQEMVLGKIKDIYTPKGYEAYVKNKEKLLIKEIDPQSFAILEKISSQYPTVRDVQKANGKVKREKVSPFKMYIEENNLPGIQKYSKKGNGPIIRQLKYYDERLNKYINITKDVHGNRIEKTKNGKHVVLQSLNPWRTDVYYDEVKQQYRLLGIKYCHLKFINKEYGIPSKDYEVLKKEEEIGEDCRFVFSLYKKDTVSFKRGEESIDALFHSKNESNKNYVELKPIDKPKWSGGESVPVFGKIAKSGQFIKGIKNVDQILKIQTDILGNKYYVSSEDKNFIID